MRSRSGPPYRFTATEGSGSPVRAHITPASGLCNSSLFRLTDQPVTLHYSSEYGPDEYRYLRCWRQVLSDPTSFRRKLVIVESWNNNDEGCAISYSEPRDFRTAAGELVDRWGDQPEFYMALTREFSPYWKAGRCPERFRQER